MIGWWGFKTWELPVLFLLHVLKTDVKNNTVTPVLTNENYFSVMSIPITGSLKENTKAAAISSDLALKLYFNTDVIGKKIVIGNLKYTISGVYEKPKGIYALYLHYCYLLNVFPKKNPYKRLPPSIKNDSLKLDKISEEAKLLVSYNLETDEQFFSFKRSKIEELNNLINERESLWYKYHHEKNNDGIDIKIKKIKPKIDEVKRILSLCEGIEKRIPKIERNVEEINIERKESEKSEHIK